MLTVKKFLFIFKLETGVTLIGYGGIFFSLIFAIAFLLTSAFKLNEVMDYLSERFAVHHNRNLPTIRK
jgi:hypothetical protein